LFSYTETNNANFADSHGLPKSGNTGINGKGKTNIGKLKKKKFNYKKKLRRITSW